MTLRKLLYLLVALVLFAAACGSDDSTESGSGDSGDYETLRVGDDGDYATIQDAVDAASAGDLNLVGEGTYRESVVIEAPDEIVIRGVDRNEVIVDGEFERENGFKVFSNGVAIENLTVRNFTTNGIFFTGDYDADVILTGYRASYVTALNNGVYGLYAFNATKGQFDNSYASGSSDAGYYVGQCNPCDALLYRVTAGSNNLGYSGTNSSDVVIVDSEWTRNRLGIVPNSQDGEKLAPVERNTIVGNLVSDNNNAETAEDNEDYRIGTGSGILAVGTVDSVIERNTVVDNERVNIVLIPWFDDVFSDGEGNDYPIVDNSVLDNVTGGAVKAADLVLALLDSSGGPNGNCFARNVYETSLPEDIEVVAPCGADGLTDFGTILEHLDAFTPGPEPIPYEDVPAPELDFEDMPGAETAPPKPATDVPIQIDLGSLEAPSRPE